MSTSEPERVLFVTVRYYRVGDQIEMEVTNDTGDTMSQVVPEYMAGPMLQMMGVAP